MKCEDLRSRSWFDINVGRVYEHYRLSQQNSGQIHMYLVRFNCIVVFSKFRLYVWHEFKMLSLNACVLILL